MPDQYDADKRTIGELLSMTSPNLEVPDWQRSYSWKTEQIEAFWQDLTNFSNLYPGDNVNIQEYFLGSIVLVVSGTRHVLLDGQQRLATATILLSVIRDFLKKYRADAATRTSQKYISDFDDESGTYTFKLTLNLYDRDFFRVEIQEEAHVENGSALDVSFSSHERIRKARKFFQDRFEEKYEELGEGEQAYR